MGEDNTDSIYVIEIIISEIMRGQHHTYSQLSGNMGEDNTDSIYVIEIIISEIMRVQHHTYTTLLHIYQG
jgi:hypothetical protein